MARFDAVQAATEGDAIHLRFRADEPGVIGWQLYDPSTGAFLKEGDWSEATADVSLRIVMPPEEGEYRVQVAPVADRSRFISIDARIEAGKLEIALPRVSTLAEQARTRLLRAIPRAFVFPARSVWRNRRLIGSMVKRDMLARYRGSVAGALWTFLSPLLLMATYCFVFGVVLQARLGTDTTGTGFVLYFLAGMLPWLAFSEAVGRSPNVILEHRSLVKKVVFPVETLPVNLVISGVLTEAIGLAIFLAGLLAVRGALPLSVAWLPALIIPQLLLTAGLCWMLAAAGVYMRDLGQITGFVLTLWFFLTPIGYPEAKLPAQVAWLFHSNPILLLVRGYRNVFLEGHAPTLRSLAALWIVSAALAILGHAWFHRLRKSFADVI